MAVSVEEMKQLGSDFKEMVFRIDQGGSNESRIIYGFEIGTIEISTLGGDPVFIFRLLPSSPKSVEEWDYWTLVPEQLEMAPFSLDSEAFKDSG